MLWRNFWPASTNGLGGPQVGKRGGLQTSQKSHWIGPGRVVLSETLAPRHSEPDPEARSHVVWILIGTQLFRASTYAVRPATERETALWSMQYPGPLPTAKIPNHVVTDLSGHPPSAEDVELPQDLPEAPAERSVWRFLRFCFNLGSGHETFSEDTTT